jgi:hypothetical protein
LKWIFELSGNEMLDVDDGNEEIFVGLIRQAFSIDVWPYDEKHFAIGSMGQKCDDRIDRMRESE